MSNWSRLQTETLIKMHLEYTNLYNCKDPEYINRIKRVESLDEIARRMEECRPGTTTKDIQLKLKTLRTQFLKERNTMRQSIKNGFGSEEVYTPKLWCYYKLQHMGEIKDDIIIEATPQKDKMSTWSRLQTENLIKIHKEYKNLHNCRDAEYKNRIKRMKSLEEIAKRMVECRPGTTTKDVQLKLKTLRTQFIKEKTAIWESKKNGCDIEKVYTPKLWCYNELQHFGGIGDDIVVEPNISFLLDISPETEAIEEDDSETQASTTPTKATKTSLVAKADKSLCSPTTFREQINTRKESPLWPFLNNLEAELVKLNEDLLAEAKLAITKIVYEMQKEQRKVDALRKPLPHPVQLIIAPQTFMKLTPSETKERKRAGAEIKSPSIKS